MINEVKTTYLKANKKFILRFLLLIILALVIYKIQLKYISIQEISIKNIYLFLLSIVLIPINFFLEFYKLKTGFSSNKIEKTENLFPAYLQGIISSFFTPDFIGNTLGRLQILDRSRNKELLSVSIFQGMAQFIIAIAFSVIGIIILKDSKFSYLISPFLVALILASLFYFFGDKMRLKTKYSRLNLFFNSCTFIYNKGPILIISLFRYLVFSVQFHALLLAFGVPWQLNQLFVLMLSYGVITLSPSILFGKILIREGIAVAIFSYFGFESGLILITAFTTWLFNVVTPVCFSTVYLGIKSK